MTLLAKRQRALGFKAWARTQARRNDPVGDFTSDWAADRRSPRVESYAAIERHLSQLPYPVHPLAFDAARAAWREFVAYRDSIRGQRRERQLARRQTEPWRN